MSRNSAPGFSIAAQVRAAKAQLRRALRKDIEKLERELAEKKEQLRVAELQRNGRSILSRAKP